MSRTRIVKGKYTKAVGGNYNILAEGNVFSSAGGQVQENGFDNGVSYGSFERIGSNVNEDFEISFSLSKDKMYSTVVPFGILDFEGNYENANFAFNYSLLLSNVDSLEFKVLNEDGTTLFAITNLPEIVVTARRLPKLSQDIKDKKPEYNLSNPIRVWDWKSVFDPYNTSSSDYTKIGSYVIFWDGFDNDNVYDSSKFNNKKLKAVITASKNGKEKSKEVEFSTKYNEVDWVDVKIDKNNKKIDTTLRVNLKDGGAEGLKCSSHLAGARDEARWVESCPWDKIPSTSIIAGKPPIKVRTKSFQELKSIVFDGLSIYWGRNKNRKCGNFVTVVSDSYEVYINPIDTKDNAMNSLPLIYNTNNGWMRSGNPGGSYSDSNLDDDAMNLFPDTGIIQRLSYNAGYIKHGWKNDSKDGWRYHNELGVNNAYDAVMEFKETAAHELGHEFLQAYGGTVYSWQHKGSSYYLPQDTKPTKGNETTWEKVTHWDEMETDGENYPLSGEIDIMKYYNNEPNPKDISRLVAAEKDVLGLIWLTKLNIK